MQTTLGADCNGIELLAGNPINYLSYVDGITLLGESAQGVQAIRDRLVMEVSRFLLPF